MICNYSVGELLKNPAEQFIATKSPVHIVCFIG
jgi:hypothetical protein